MAASPPIDYTNLGYEALRDAMLAQAREWVPEWTDQSENDLGVLLVELFAYACDLTLYYQTRIAANLLPETSDEPEPLVQLLRLIGYELRPPSAATASLRLSFAAAVATPITIPARTAFYARVAGGPEVAFETARDQLITLAQLSPPDGGQRHFFPLPVVEGRTVAAEAAGISDGSANQVFALARSPVLAGSVEVTVAEPAALTRWELVESLSSSTPADRHFLLQRDAAGRALIRFGDGVNGMVPPRGTAIAPVTVSATYRVGGGAQGNVPPGTAFRPALPLVQAAICQEGGGGGEAGESLDRARALAPRLFRTQERAVTADDYRDLALQLPGVGKALAVSVGWNLVVLFVAPSGRVAEPSDLLKRDLLEFLERRRMTTTFVRVVGARAANVFLTATVHAQPYFLRADVQAAVEGAVQAYLAFEAVDFGQSVFLSRIYDVIQSLPHVAAVNVTEFSRTPGGGVEPTGILPLAPDELPRLARPGGLQMTIVGGVA